MTCQRRTSKLIAGLLLSSMLFKPLFVFAAIDQLQSLPTNNIGEVTVSAPLESINFPGKVVSGSIGAMPNEKFDEVLSQLDGREFSDLTDKDLDDERAGYFWTLMFLAASIGFSIYSTVQTVQNNHAYTFADFWNQWGTTLGSGAGAAGEFAALQGATNVASYLKTADVYASAADVITKQTQNNSAAAQLAMVKFAAKVSGGDLNVAAKILDNFNKGFNIFAADHVSYSCQWVRNFTHNTWQVSYRCYSSYH